RAAGDVERAARVAGADRVGRGAGGGAHRTARRGAARDAARDRAGAAGRGAVFRGEGHARGVAALQQVAVAGGGVGRAGGRAHLAGLGDGEVGVHALRVDGRTAHRAGGARSAAAAGARQRAAGAADARRTAAGEPLEAGDVVAAAALLGAAAAHACRG